MFAASASFPASDEQDIFAMPSLAAGPSSARSSPSTGPFTPLSMPAAGPSSSPAPSSQVDLSSFDFAEQPTFSSSFTSDYRQHQLSEGFQFTFDSDDFDLGHISPVELGTKGSQRTTPSEGFFDFASCGQVPRDVDVEMSTEEGARDEVTPEDVLQMPAPAFDMPFFDDMMSGGCF